MANDSKAGTFHGAGGTPIRYLVQGAGPPLTLIHGVGANLESWDEVALRLTPYFTVARFDLRGYGGSGRIGACSIDDFVADVAGLLDVLGSESTDLAGFSLGGLIAQHFATLNPARVRRLALLSTVAQRTPDERARVLQRADQVRDEGIAAVVAAASDRWFSPAFKAANPVRVEQRLQELIANDHRSYAAAYRVFGEADAGLRPEAITQPTLIVTGEHDQGSSPRMAHFLHDHIEGSELHILPKMRHSLLLEIPDQIAALLLEFFGGF